MKIVMTVSNPFKPDPRVYKEALTLVEKGYNVTIISWDREVKYPDFEIINGIKVVRVKIKSEYGTPMHFLLGVIMFYLKSLLLLMKMDFDVVHTHDFDTAPLGFIVKLLKSIKWVYDVHDLYSSMAELSLGKKVAKIVDYIDRYFWRHADVIFTASPKVTQVIKVYNPKVFTILNSVDPIPMLGLKRAEMFTVFYGGVLSGNRFLLEMLEISRDLKINYRVAGDGWPKIREFLKSNLGQNFLGFIPHDKIFHELEKAHLTFAIYDPHFENIRLSLPNKVFEAASVKTPILVSKGTALAELVFEMGIGWAVDYDIDDVRNKLAFLIENPKYLRRAGHRGYKVFLHKYTWELIKWRVIMGYREVVFQ